MPLSFSITLCIYYANIIFIDSYKPRFRFRRLFLLRTTTWEMFRLGFLHESFLPLSPVQRSRRLTPARALRHILCVRWTFFGVRKIIFFILCARRNLHSVLRDERFFTNTPAFFGEACSSWFLFGAVGEAINTHFVQFWRRRKGLALPHTRKLCVHTIGSPLKRV